MCNNRQHDSENVRLRHENAELKASRSEYMDMLQAYSGLLYEIRKAAGDQEGRLMQNELIAYIAELKQSADAIHARNTAQDWPAWRITFQSSDQAGQAAFSMLKQARDEIEKLNVMINQGIA